MEKKKFLKAFRDSLSEIRERRLFANERGYQGRLVAVLENRLDKKNVFPEEPLIEQEHQKTLDKHGITIRPDIVVHVPHEHGIFENRQEGNYVIIQFKRRASEARALEDFHKLDVMFERLSYELGIFLNIDSDTTFFECYAGEFSDRIHCFAVELKDSIVIIYESSH